MFKSKTKTTTQDEPGTIAGLTEAEVLRLVQEREQTRRAGQEAAQAMGRAFAERHLHKYEPQHHTQIIEAMTSMYAKAYRGDLINVQELETSLEEYFSLETRPAYLTRAVFVSKD